MLMNELLKERFFSLLSEPSQEVINEEIQNAYDCFMEQLRQGNRAFSRKDM